jgi:hypothetical protein
MDGRRDLIRFGPRKEVFASNTDLASELRGAEVAPLNLSLDRLLMQ